MYNKYFYSKVVDKALLTDEHTDEVMESYMFRIINLTNKNTRLDALNGLRDIWKVLDIKNISKVNSTEAAFNVALNMFDVILNNLSDGIENVNPDTGEVTYDKADGDASSESGEGSETGSEMSEEEFEFDRKESEVNDSDRESMTKFWKEVGYI